MTRALRTRILLGSVAAGALTLLPGAAQAQEISTFDSGSTGVGGVSEERPRSEVVEVAGVQVQRPSSQARALPVTGSDVAGLVVLGGGAIALGAVALTSAKRSKPATN